MARAAMSDGDPIWGPRAADVGPGITVHADAWNEADIPVRPWIARGYFLRRAVSVISGPGSAGKSSLMVAWSASLATNRQFGAFRSADDRPLRVAVYNVEDDLDEQQRRFSAMCRQLDVPVADLMRNLRIITPNGVGTLLTTGFTGPMVNTKAMEELEQFIDEWKPDLLLLDPFVELHSAEENDNTAVRHVMSRLRTLAQDFNMAVGVLHHARKGLASPGDPDSLRGASSIVGAARVALTVNVMTEEEAVKLAIPLDTRRDYFRVDGAKKNYSAITDAEWFERLEYTLENGQEGETPDRVAVPYPWKPPSVTITQELIAQLLNDIANGSPNGPWSPRLSPDARSFRRALEARDVADATSQKKAVSALLDMGVREAEFYDRPGKDKRTRKGYRTADGAPHCVAWVE